MEDEDGWGHVVGLLQQHKQGRGEKKRKDAASVVSGHPLPSWMHKCVYSDSYEASEYIEINQEYFAAPVRKKRLKVKHAKDEIVVDSQSDIPPVDNEQVQNKDENTNLDKDLLASLKKSLENWQNVPPPQFSYLRETPLLAEALTELALFTLRDETLAEISRHFISLEGSSYVQCLTFAKHALLPKVSGLTTTASRALVGGLVHCAKLHPAPIMHGLLIPLVTADTGPVQSEVVNRIAFVEKCLSPELCQEFMREIVAKKQVWTDPFVVLITNALNLNLPLTDEVASLLASQACKQADSFANNPKFAKLILLFITKYPALAKQHVVSLQQTLGKCKNFMAKSALTQLEKL
eukprot:Phypoly_transcript_11112.p1 GENE.Phypoly_transcript_11112~~Phypoly_transcript_11112.p1  ORF type:complete len:350 (+),score=39.23 Phypoly_transcript_11112:62-1111(+)